MMKNISRENDENLVEKHFPQKDTTIRGIFAGPFFGLVIIFNKFLVDIWNRIDHVFFFTKYNDNLIYAQQ